MAIHRLSNNDSIRISVIICTYNRCALLTRSLESFSRLIVSADLDWELLVVDNNSSDDTYACIDRYLNCLPLRYLFESRQGKTFALNRGVSEARGELLVFTDDDVLVDRNWLTAYLNAANEYPEIGWFGGRIDPWWQSGRPRWLKQESIPALSGYFVIYDLGDEVRLYHGNDRPPVGANMVVRRETFEQIGGYREDLGPRGKHRGTGDDTELIYRAQRAGVPGLYVPGARCKHWVGEERLPLRKFFQFGVRKGMNQALMIPEVKSNGLLFFLSQALRATYQVIKGRWDRVRICLMNIGIEWGHLLVKVSSMAPLTNRGRQR